MAKIKTNCWDMMLCGRGPDAPARKRCPVVIAEEFDGTNRGHNGGRYCWAIVGTLCGGQVQGKFADKLRGCLECEFFKQVEREEGSTLVFLPPELA